MKSLRPLLLAALLLAPGFSRAEENRYDVLSKLLLPFAHVLTKDAKTPNRALRLTARLERLTDLPPALVGSRVEIAVQQSGAEGEHHGHCRGFDRPTPRVRVGATEGR